MFVGANSSKRSVGCDSKVCRERRNTAMLAMNIGRSYNGANIIQCIYTANAMLHNASIIMNQDRAWRMGQCMYNYGML